MADARFSDRLDSWKAIAAYLGRSVRTAKRWESEEGLPVHRHMHRHQGTVYGLKSEIDRWREARNLGPSDPGVPHESTDKDQRPGVLVLPFEHIGPDEAQRWLARGMTEELIDRLSQRIEIRVLSRTSSQTLLDQRADARAIGRRHSVSHLIEGTTRCDADCLRVSVRLIDVASDAALWADSFDGPLDSALRLQARIAEDASMALSQRLRRPLTEAGSFRSVPSSTAEWQCVVLARQDALKWRRDGLEAAIQRLEAGLETMGRRPALLAALGHAWLHYREAGIEPGPEPLRQARSCASELAQLVGHDPALLRLEGWILYAEGDVLKAIASLRAAESLEPDHPETLGLLVNCLLISDFGEQAEARIAHLQSIDPLTPLTACLPGWKLLLDGNFGDALPHYQRMFELDRANPMARMFFGSALALAREHDALGALFTTDGHAEPENPVERAGHFLADAVLGRARPERWLTRSVVATAENNEMLARFLADGFAALGDSESAVRWIGRAVELGFIHYPFLAERNPLLRALDRVPAMDALLEQTRKRWSERQAFA